MMRNGTGKTTTITLMRAILSGSATTWTPDIVRGFKPTQSQVSQGKFYIKVKFGTESYHYNLVLDYDEGKASYQTTRVGLSGGLEAGHELPMQLKGVFNNEGFISRFIFDGEQAKKTLSSSSKEAELAITYLYRIDKLDDLILVY
jgi:DNA sulfur modification protein DndD